MLKADFTLPLIRQQRVKGGDVAGDGVDGQAGEFAQGVDDRAVGGVYHGHGEAVMVATNGGAAQFGRDLVRDELFQA